MIIHFSINFRTFWGQNLYISGSLPELGGGDPAKAVPMNYYPGDFWKADIRISSLEERRLTYKYFVRTKTEAASMKQVAGDPSDSTAHRGSFFSMTSGKAIPKPPRS